ncbi:imidazoleglycerol-phosphate dehydratase HisB [Botrimarina hoheduenensis]|uniref:Imidazoleglycerol-phosphate dehydratase n=1 Tax=Botrimarina hoheduenensis TaxID=2528000 RepID=A0A5C5VT62_9BACT|nr:imidazoleglycerol-phosphate dehydratase HisB [Botrimarina hoheduenensis]TWT40809.1 Imidazoleglycerol-phosphate dehydratase [Botrimarina hoheduenensis]
MSRTATIERSTRETQIRLSLDLDPPGGGSFATGIGFLDHMLELFAKHGGFGLKVEATGDLHVDQHHTTEDIGICLGQAFRQALGDKAGIYRYGSITLPMDETLVTAAVDFGGRSAFHFGVELSDGKIGEFDAELIEHFWQSFAPNAECNLHFIQHHGKNRHHIAEAVFKAAARAMAHAVSPDPRAQGVPSTKGTLSG